MRAVQIREYGDPAVLQMTTEAPRPPLGEDQVLVHVRAAAVNPFDLKVRAGLTRQMGELRFPATLGGDLAGLVEAVGRKVTGFRVGEKVYGQAGALSGNGSYAEYAPVAANSLAAMPQSLDFVQAAALPLAGVSAWQALVEHLGLRPGQKVLIHGGAGGIGSLALQLAKHLGAYAATTVSGEDTDFVSRLGADEVIDYHTQDFAALLTAYDAVFDTVGGDTYRRSFAVLRPGGKIVSMVESVDESLAAQHHVEAIYQFTRVTSERLREVGKLVDAGVLKVQVDRTFSLAQADEAHAYLAGRHRGKVILTV